MARIVSASPLPLSSLLDSSCLGGWVGVRCRSRGYPLPPYPSTRVQAQRLPPTPLLTGLQIAVTVVLSDSVTPSPHALPPSARPRTPYPQVPPEAVTSPHAAPPRARRPRSGQVRRRSLWYVDSGHERDGDLLERRKLAHVLPISAQSSKRRWLRGLPSCGQREAPSPRRAPQTMRDARVPLHELHTSWSLSAAETMRQQPSASNWWR